MINHIVVMRSAREKFMELDVDHSGYIEGYEIDLLLNWMLSSFCPYGEPLPFEEKQLIKDEMMRKTDENAGMFSLAIVYIFLACSYSLDGRISIEEFSVLFEEMTLMLTLPEDSSATFGDGSSIALDSSLEGSLGDMHASSVSLMDSPIGHA